MAEQFAGKVALITGGSRGIGLATARAFIAEGGRVVIADINAQGGMDAVKELGERARFQSLDVTQPDDWQAAMDAVEQELGGLDVLVNCAGIFWMRSIEETTPDAFETMWRIKELGTFLGLRAAIAPMRRRGGGVIINLSSTAGLSGNPMTLAYATTKWGVRGMSRVAAAELGPEGIRVLSVHPGLTDTPMNHEALGKAGIAAAAQNNPLGRAASAEEIAGLITWLAFEQGAFCTGSEFVIDGGSTAA